MNVILEYKNIIESPLFSLGPIVMFMWRNEEGWPVEAVSKNIETIFSHYADDYLHSKLIYSNQIHPEDLECVGREVMEASASGLKLFVHEPYRYNDGNGKYHWVNDTTMILRDDAGKITHYVGYINDITKEMEGKQKLEDTLSIERTIFENIDYILITTDKNGIITKFNKKAEELLGYKAEEVIAKKSPAIFHVESEVTSRAQELSKELNTNIANFDVFVAKSDRNLDNECEWTYVTKDGHKFPVLLSITAMRNKKGEIRGYIGVAKDITQKKEFQASLLQAKENAEHSSHSKSQFLANMSHEIRTPLNAIMGFIDLLQKDEIAPKKLEYLNIIKSSSKSLLGVINDVLDISKIEDGKLEIDLTSFNSKEQLNEIVEFFRTSAVQKKSKY